MFTKIQINIISVAQPRLRQIFSFTGNVMYCYLYLVNITYESLEFLTRLLVLKSKHVEAGLLIQEKRQLSSILYIQLEVCKAFPIFSLRTLTVLQVITRAIVNSNHFDDEKNV